MIKITNGAITLTVPNAAYRTIYRSSGFRPLDDEEHVVTPTDTFPAHERKTPSARNLDEEKDESEDFEETYNGDEVDLSEIPLSEMDFYQLCDYADQLGLDRKGLRSKKELRVLIRNNT